MLLFGQKTEEKIIDNSAIKNIVINGDAIFKIEVKTAETKTIKLSYNSEGEYAQNTILLTETRNDSLIISNIMQFLVGKIDDKLSAHKVLSIEISLEIPKFLSVSIKSAIASAKISGTYNYLLLELNQGNAQVSNFLGNATINTFNGNIDLETNYAIIDAKTETGTLKMENIIKSQNQIQITSINGNINIRKTKK